MQIVIMGKLEELMGAEGILRVPACVDEKEKQKKRLQEQEWDSLCAYSKCHKCVHRRQCSIKTTGLGREGRNCKEIVCILFRSFRQKAL